MCVIIFIVLIILRASWTLTAILDQKNNIAENTHGAENYLRRAINFKKSAYLFPRNPASYAVLACINDDFIEGGDARLVLLFVLRLREDEDELLRLRLRLVLVWGIYFHTT